MSRRSLVLCAASFAFGCSDLPTLPAPVRPPLPSTAGAFVLTAAPPPVGTPTDPPVDIANAPIPATSAEPSPAATPVAEPTVAPAPSPTPAAPPPSGGSGGGSGGGGTNGGARPPNILLVDDEVETNTKPSDWIDGATVTIGNLPPLTTTGGGMVDVPGAIAGHITISAPGFVTSVITGITPDITTVHLRRAGGQAPEFNQRQTRVQGTIADEASLIAPRVFFANAVRAGGQPVTAVGGAFGLDVVQNSVAEPVGVVFVIAGRQSDGELMYGASKTIRPFVDAPPPGPLAIATPIALAPATRRIPYTATFPAGPLDRTEATLTYNPYDGGPAVAIDSSVAPNGAFMATPDGALAGAWRVQMAATDATGDLTSLAIVDPGGGSAIATLLPSPTITAVAPEGTGDAAAHRVQWTTVADAKGYRVEIRRDGIEGPTWEAWTGQVSSVAIPDADWPGPGQGHVVVQAIDADGLSTRSLASIGAAGAPRRLRIEPWTTQALFKVSTARRRT